jgi:hypothetical protein
MLAEILSWSRDSRREAEALYRSVLELEPASVPARVGLARLLSWRGDLDRSRSLYMQALYLDTGDTEARVGLAETERWSGRARDALRTLEQLPPDERDRPEARRGRAEAWLDLDRPARALAEYEAILAEDPDDTDAARQAVMLRRRLQPSVEVGVAASTESGDPRTTRVETLSAPLQVHWGGSGDWRYRAGVGVAFFQNRPGSTRRLSAGLGAEGPLGRRVRLRAEAAANEFQGGGTEATGRVEVRMAAGERLDLVAGLRRDPVLDSRLSAAGETVDGVHYGPVLESAAYAGLSARPGRGWDLWLRASRGRLAGDNVADNDRDGLFGGFGRTLRTGAWKLRPGFASAWFRNDLDLSGYPPDDLGGDGVTMVGVGGTFSPFRFLNNMIRLDASWEGRGGTAVYLGGGLGLQQVEDLGSPDFGDTTVSSDVYAGARWRLGESTDLRAEASFQNVAAAFDRTRVGLFLVRRF